MAHAALAATTEAFPPEPLISVNVVPVTHTVSRTHRYSLHPPAPIDPSILKACLQRHHFLVAHISSTQHKKIKRAGAWQNQRNGEPAVKLMDN